jgi:hypothetical protein
MTLALSRPPWLAWTSVLVWVGAACAHQTVGRPPDASEIAEINAAAAGSPMQVAYVQPLPSCSTGQCAGVAPDIIRIERIDPQVMTFRTVTGEIQTVPTEIVAGVSFNDRGPNAVLGAAVGATLGFALGTFGYFATRGAPDQQDHPDDQGFRSATPTILVFSALLGLAGAGIGALVGGRRTVDFGPVQ